MKLLLDTNALIWAMGDDAKLGTKARSAIADRRNVVRFSVVSLWEILIKVRVGKLALDWRRLATVAEAEGFDRLGVEPAHLEALAVLPFRHRDPFDHLILAQTIAERATLITSDEDMTRYGVATLMCG